MDRVVIIGNGGTGKSVLARELGKSTGLPVFHLDAVFWKSGWEPTPKDEWMMKVEELVRRPAWIMDGNYSSTMDLRLKEADTIIFLDYSRWMSIYGIVKRRIMYRNQTRPDMAEGCKEKLDSAFVKWVWNYDKERAPLLREKLKKVKDTQIHHFRSRKELQAWLARL
ncbi:DNA topology modulation protein [Pradoshia sp.]